MGFESGLASGWGRAQWEVEGQLGVGDVSGGSECLMALVGGGRDTGSDGHLIQSEQEVRGASPVAQ